jgi:hypothetical protein
MLEEEKEENRKNVESCKKVEEDARKKAEENQSFKDVRTWMK